MTMLLSVPSAACHCRHTPELVHLPHPPHFPPRPGPCHLLMERWEEMDGGWWYGGAFLWRHRFIPPRVRIAKEGERGRGMSDDDKSNLFRGRVCVSRPESMHCRHMHWGINHAETREKYTTHSLGLGTVRDAFLFISPSVALK